MNDESNEEKPSPVPLSPAARRVLGVLVEKAKTTPDHYPLTLAGVIAGSNQKSNRAPKMDLDEDDALLALDELRKVGAAREIQGSGRSNKYRHTAYEWMDIDSPQSAIMTELLLRGPQTAGEIRTRASRMSPFADLNATQTVLNALIEKGLVEALSPPGRGQTFAHTLYPPDERQYLDAKVAKQAASTAPAPESKNLVDQLLSRLDTVTERIDNLEKRLKELES
tara:strand:+ start:165251 stop:165922 length:672 start_codon:yes stop_codon:yes gene_type:complete